MASQGHHVSLLLPLADRLLGPAALAVLLPLMTVLDGLPLLTLAHTSCPMLLAAVLLSQRALSNTPAGEGH